MTFLAATLTVLQSLSSQRCIASLLIAMDFVNSFVAFVAFVFQVEQPGVHDPSAEGHQRAQATSPPLCLCVSVVNRWRRRLLDRSGGGHGFW